MGVAYVSNSMNRYQLKKREIVFIRISFILLTPRLFFMKCQVHQLAIDAYLAFVLGRTGYGKLSDKQIYLTTQSALRR